MKGKTVSVYESETPSLHVVNPESRRTETLRPEPPELPTDPSASTTLLARQNSILSLTLEEIQLKSGKNFASMNMDEFLANLWTVDEIEKPQEAKSAEIVQSVLPRPIIPVPLCKKTVDEVWSEIQKGVWNGDNVRQPSCDHNSGEDFSRRQTLGEITLEDFLVKAGVVQQPLNTAMTVTDFVADHVSNSEFNLGFSGRNPNGTVSGYGNRSVYSVFSGDQNCFGESSSSVLDNNGKNSRFLTDLDAFGMKKRIIDGPQEVLLERRQRRMIKNRESAARSRARRQAYTVELELELNHLTEENLKLKKILEESEKKRKQEVMKRNQQSIREKKGEKLRKIRRIVSTGW